MNLGISVALQLIYVVLWCAFDTWAIHHLMNKEELDLYFGPSPPHLPEYEIVYWPTTYRKILHLNAFGRHIELKLEANSHLLAESFQFNIVDQQGRFQDESTPQSCHYTFSNASCAAAVSFCTGLLLRGFIFLADDTWEILPLSERLEALLEEGLSDPQWGRHIVKRVSIPPSPEILDDSFFFSVSQETIPTSMPSSLSHFFRFKRKNRFRQARKSPNPTLETALFLDEPGYILFSPYFNNDDQKLRDMLLAYVNAVQALYHHPSTGQYLDIVLVRLDIFKKQPLDLPHHGGERSKLLDSFCTYSAKHNALNDKDPDHWDISLYVSGLDFYAIENGVHSGATMGLATVGGVCTEKYSCIIAELGTTNEYGNPYPSSGFTSVYILAHEIGHNLGMHHDGSSNYCSKEGYIMSPSRGTSGEVSWSTCSSDVLQTLASKECLQDKPKMMSSAMDHSKFNEHPGKVWTAKKQCEVLLRDSNAEVWIVENGENICTILRCHNKKQPEKLYVAGPALDGTQCAAQSICKSGECVRQSSSTPIQPTPPSTTKPPPKPMNGEWGDWKSGECKSECLQKSRGHQTLKRICKNVQAGCKGKDEDSILCKDEKICKKSKRISAAEYATQKCKALRKVLTSIDDNVSGMQTPHNNEKVWTSCAIFCRKKLTEEYFAPQVELRASAYADQDLYFPDGTWCHNDGKYHYYCLNHECLKESKASSKSKFKLEELSAILFDDYNFMDNSLRPESLEYQNLQDHQFDFEKGVDVHDYIELPQ